MLQRLYLLRLSLCYPRINHRNATVLFNAYYRPTIKAFKPLIRMYRLGHIAGRLLYQSSPADRIRLHQAHTDISEAV